MDFSRAEAAFMASSGSAPSISFLRNFISASVQSLVLFKSKHILELAQEINWLALFQAFSFSAHPAPNQALSSLTPADPERTWSA